MGSNVRPDRCSVYITLLIWGLAIIYYKLRHCIGMNWIYLLWTLYVKSYWYTLPYFIWLGIRYNAVIHIVLILGIIYTLSYIFYVCSKICILLVRLNINLPPHFITWFYTLKYKAKCIFCVITHYIYQNLIGRVESWRCI